MKIVLDPTSSKEEYEKLFEQPVRTVFMVTDGYETVLRRIEEYKPESLKTFKVTPITPGTSLFTEYGCNHVIVTKKD